MATQEEVDRLRRLANYDESDPYDDEDLALMLDGLGNINFAAARLWNEKAASLTTLVNVSESGSSRSMGDAYKNALAMAKYFKGLGDEEVVETPVDTSQYARTRAIVRESA
jgi:hypothetical protein